MGYQPFKGAGARVGAELGFPKIRYGDVLGTSFAIYTDRTMPCDNSTIRPPDTDPNFPMPF